MVAYIWRGRLSGFPYRALCRHVGAQAISLAYKIRNDPAALALLNPVDFEANELGAAQPAGDRKRQDGAVALLILITQLNGVGVPLLSCVWGRGVEIGVFIWGEGWTVTSFKGLLLRSLALRNHVPVVVSCTI